MPYLQANAGTAYGAIPYGRIQSTRAYSKDAAAVAIYPGDFVIMETDGGIGVAATGSTNIIGVAAEYSAASTAKTDFLVYDGADQEYMIRDDSDTTAMTEASIGQNCNITVTTGSTSLLRSRHELDSSTANTTATLALKVMGLHPIEGRTFASAAGSPKSWVVKINNHFWSPYQQVGV